MSVAHIESMLRIYTTGTCVYCHYAKSFMEQRGIAFEEVRVDADDEAAVEMMRLSGQRGVPVITNGHGIVVGFNPQGITQLAGNT